MPVHKRGTLAAFVGDERRHVVDQKVEIVDHPELDAGGLAVTAVIERQHLEATAAKKFGDMFISPRMLGVPVHQEHVGHRLTLGFPDHRVDVDRR
jgi:hypothetical protein